MPPGARGESIIPGLDRLEETGKRSWLTPLQGREAPRELTAPPVDGHSGAPAPAPKRGAKGKRGGHWKQGPSRGRIKPWRGLEAQEGCLPTVPVDAWTRAGDNALKAVGAGRDRDETRIAAGNHLPGSG